VSEIFKKNEEGSTSFFPDVLIIRCNLITNIYTFIMSTVLILWPIHCHTSGI